MKSASCGRRVEFTRDDVTPGSFAASCAPHQPREVARDRVGTRAGGAGAIECSLGRERGAVAARPAEPSLPVVENTAAGDERTGVSLFRTIAPNAFAHTFSMAIRALRTEWDYKTANTLGVSQQDVYRDHIASIAAECDCGYEWIARRGLPVARGGIVRTIGWATLICPKCRAQQQFTIAQLDAGTEREP